jgi:DTW domain-containing protein YfiP
MFLTDFSGEPAIFSVRQDCEGCGRPPSVCLCNFLPTEKLKLNTKVVIIKSNQEEKKCRLNSVNLIKRSIDCDVFIRNQVSQKSDIWNDIEKLAAEHEIPIAVLFPTKNSIPIEEFITSHLHPRSKASKVHAINAQKAPSSILVVIDATWPTAKKMYNRSTAFRGLPCITVNVKDKVGYGKIRKEPDDRPECVSTLEAVAACLVDLEKASGNQMAQDLFKIITRPLVAMINQQLEFQKQSLEADQTALK